MRSAWDRFDDARFVVEESGQLVYDMGGVLYGRMIHANGIDIQDIRVSELRGPTRCIVQPSRSIRRWVLTDAYLFETGEGAILIVDEKEQA